MVIEKIADHTKKDGQLKSQSLEVLSPHSKELQQLHEYELVGPKLSIQLRLADLDHHQI
jgi:hypothetical protein